MGKKIFGFDAVPFFLIVLVAGFLFFTPQGSDIRKGLGLAAVVEGGPSEVGLQSAQQQGKQCPNPNLSTLTMTAQGYDYKTRGSIVGALTYTGYVNGQWAQAQSGGTGLTTVPGAFVDVRASNSSFFTARITRNLECQGADTAKFYMGEIGPIVLRVYNSTDDIATGNTATGAQTLGSGGEDNVKILYSQNESSPFSTTTSYGSNPQINKHYILLSANSTTVIDTAKFSVSGCSSGGPVGISQYALQNSYERVFTCPGAIEFADGNIQRTVHVGAVSGQNPTVNHSMDILIQPSDWLLNQAGQFVEDGADEAGTRLVTSNVGNFTLVFS